MRIIESSESSEAMSTDPRNQWQYRENRSHQRSSRLQVPRSSQIHPRRCRTSERMIESRSSGSYETDSDQFSNSLFHNPREVVRLRTPPPVYRRIVEKAPTPPPCVIERIIVRPAAQKIVERIIERPRTPPPRIIHRTVTEPSPPPIIRTTYVKVQPHTAPSYYYNFNQQHQYYPGSIYPAQPMYRRHVAYDPPTSPIQPYQTLDPSTAASRYADDEEEREVNASQHTDPGTYSSLASYSRADTCNCYPTYQLLTGQPMFNRYPLMIAASYAAANQFNNRPLTQPQQQQQWPNQYFNSGLAAAAAPFISTGAFNNHPPYWQQGCYAY